MLDTQIMQETVRPGSRVPPIRIARWAVPGVVVIFAVISALPQHRSPAVAAGALGLAVIAALLMDPGRPALLPAFAGLSAAGLAVLGSGSSSDVGWFAVCVLAGWCAFTASTRATVALWAAFVIMFALEWLLTTFDLGWASWIAGTTFAAFACLLARRQRDLADQLRIAQAGLADRVRAEERNRIARELHDVIAHSLTVSLLHVSSARLAVEEDSAEAVRALAEAERLGRECLTEVRQVVGLLRRDEGASTAPLPGAAQLTALVEQFRGAGAEVTLDTDGDPAGLTATVGLALYRILQEALTNAARHAAGSRTRAALSVTATSAILVVDSSGPPGSGTGAGLLSMRERAGALGGTCTAGPADGGWRVRAELPLRPAPRPAAYP
jgi:signal transduction histidine kinase